MFVSILENIKTFLMADFVLTITVSLSVFLAIISLFSGLRRKDFMAIKSPRTFTTIGLGIFFAIALRILERKYSTSFNIELFPVSNLLLGISHLPLIILALAYGPSIALISTVLFIAITSQNYSVNWLDAVFLLELVVLGWWAIFPSSFQKRWAGAVNLIITYILVWGTAGTAYFYSQGLDIRDWQVHFSYHQNYLFSLFVSVMFLLLIGPKLFSILFSGSRIIPKENPINNTNSRGLALLSQNPPSTQNETHDHTPFAKPKTSNLKRSDSRVRSMSSSPERIAMRSFKDQEPESE